MPSDQCDGHADGRVHGAQELRAALTGLAKISAFGVDLFNNIPTNWLESWFIRLLQPNSKVQIKSQRNNSHQLVEVVVNQFHTCHGSSNQQFKTMRLLQPNDSSDQQP